MAARPRIRRRANWPENMHEPRPGYYTWRDPRDGKTHILGRVALAQAIHETIEANAVVETSVKRQTLAERLQQHDRTIENLIGKMNTDGLAENTIAARRSLDKIIKKKFPCRSIDTFTTVEVSDFLEEIKARGKMRWAHSMRARLADLFTKATALGWIERNPVLATERVKVKVTRERLTLEQFNMILAKAPEVAAWLPNMMLLALVSGQDRSTVAAWPRNSVKDGEAVVFRQKTKRSIAIPVALRMDAIGLSLAEVIAMCKSNVVSPYLIHHKQNRGMVKRGDIILLGTISDYFAEARLLAGIPKENAPSFHEIRSLTKRLYIEQGGVDTKALLGHSSDAVANMYADNRGIEPIKVKISAR
jgi:integrase